MLKEGISIKKQISKGKILEEEFKKSCEEQDIWNERIKDNQLSYSTNFSTSQNKYDFHCFDGEVLYGIECKRTHLSYLTVDRKKDDNKVIRLHQINSLAKDNQYKNILCGFFLDFQTSGNTYLLYIDDFLKWYNCTDKKSISEKEIQALNPIIVDKELKRTKYRYNVQSAFEQLKQDKLYHYNDIL